MIADACFGTLCIIDRQIPDRQEHDRNPQTCHHPTQRDHAPSVLNDSRQKIKDSLDIIHMQTQRKLPQHRGRAIAFHFRCLPKTTNIQPLFPATFPSES
ncbi:hypothetical protein [Gluconacetobacter sacchari]|uniref:Uncharacterized protein n=1 Tax=Gluconacetobacter sacchari TaxID=92759 RepID=A0A7W4IGJ4_9PROT|nr:hypothetical protein [Gluconacetobacter sacchari]MBB2162445.1 hypothetical protein [Gluconacetobacter sacchari]